MDTHDQKLMNGSCKRYIDFAFSLGCGLWVLDLVAMRARACARLHATVLTHISSLVALRQLVVDVVHFKILAVL